MAQAVKKFAQMSLGERRKYIKMASAVHVGLLLSVRHCQKLLRDAGGEPDREDIVSDRRWLESKIRWNKVRFRRVRSGVVSVDFSKLGDMDACFKFPGDVRAHETDGISFAVVERAVRVLGSFGNLHA